MCVCVSERERESELAIQHVRKFSDRKEIPHTHTQTYMYMYSRSDV